jgi:hypothetical protein
MFRPRSTANLHPALKRRPTLKNVLIGTINVVSNLAAKDDIVVSGMLRHPSA